MFDERHLQLSSAYAKSSEYFIRTAIYPLVIFLYKEIAQEIRHELDKKTKLEIGEEEYMMTPDEDGGWKWEKYNKETNEFVPTTDEVKEELDELVFESVAETVETLHPETEAESTPTITSESSVESSPFTNNPVTESTSTNEPVYPTTVLQNSTIPQRPVHDVSESRLEPNHWQEIVEGSAIAPAIAELNFKSLGLDPIEQHHEAWEYLIYSEEISRRNDGRLRQGKLVQYQHIENGGWWCNGGVDPRSFANLKPGEQPESKLWGCFKPETPRPKRDDEGQIIEGKFIKYEHPPNVGTSIFLLDVPDDVAERIYDKAGVNPSESDRQSGFWYCAWKHNVPVTITEGAKKTASLLSQGHAAIGVPGINNGYRTKDEQGDRIAPILQEELAVFATPEREVKICFDYESKRKTRRNINIATYRTGQLFEDAGAKVGVIQLPGPDKGVDDFIVAQGSQTFEELNQKAQPLQDWHQSNQQHLRLSIFLKNGQEIKLYEQKGDGTVKVASQDEVEEQVFGKAPRKKIIAQESEQDSTLPVMPVMPTLPQPPQIDTDFSKVVADYHQEQKQEQKAPTPQISSQSTPSQPIQAQNNQSWARQQRVTLYKQTEPRKELEKRENGEMAIAAFYLVKNYGVQQESQEADKKISIYHADAFAIKKEIKKEGNNYTIFRRSDKKVLMRFETDQSSTPGIRITEQPQEMLPVERQEFLLVSDYIKSCEKFPSPDEDPRKIANKLGSLSPKGTHAILESFKHREVFEVLTQTLSKFQRDDLTIGNYRILYQKSQRDNLSRLQLLKNDNNGTTRVAASFDINRTQEGMTYQVKALAVNELDLNKLRLLAQKLDIPQKATTPNPHATRDIEVAVHPDIAKYIEKLDPTEQPQTQTNKSNGKVFPLYPELKKSWQETENNKRWLPVDYDGRSILPLAFLSSSDQVRTKIKNNQGLTIKEQREVYYAVHTQAQSEILAYRKTDISLSPLDDIIKDLTQQSNLNNQNTATTTAQLQTQNTVNTTERSPNSKTVATAERPVKRQSTPQTQTIKSDSAALPLHPELQRAWQDIEDSKRWNPLAQQASDEFRSKIPNGLTISEQRELYFVVQAQAQTEIRANEKTDIVLSPLNDIIKDLRQQSPLDNQANHDQTRDIQLRLHPDLAKHWQDLEINKKWTGVADQWNFPLRQKLRETGKLTIGEQREVYQKLVVQREVELNRNQTSEISLPPFSQILDDLRGERENVINNTYSPKVEVIKPEQHKDKAKSTPEVEL